MKPKLLFLGPDKYAGPWTDAFAELAPEIAFEVYQEGQALSGIPYCLTWKAPPGLWPQMTDLKVVFSLAAGVDRLLADPTFPRPLQLSESRIGWRKQQLDAWLDSRPHGWAGP